jgi:hypothetical protein
MFGIYYERTSKKVSAVKLEGSSAMNMALGVKLLLEKGMTDEECKEELGMMVICLT